MARLHVREHGARARHDQFLSHQSRNNDTIRFESFLELMQEPRRSGQATDQPDGFHHASQKNGLVSDGGKLTSSVALVLRDQLVARLTLVDMEGWGAGSTNHPGKNDSPCSRIQLEVLESLRTTRSRCKRAVERRVANRGESANYSANGGLPCSLEATRWRVQMPLRRTRPPSSLPLEVARSDAVLIQKKKKTFGCRRYFHTTAFLQSFCISISTREDGYLSRSDWLRQSGSSNASRPWCFA